MSQEILQLKQESEEKNISFNKLKIELEYENNSLKDKVKKDYENFQ